MADPRGDSDSFVAELLALLGDERAATAAGERSQERVLRDIAAQEATFAGIALDLAESGAGVIARTAAGRPHRGQLLAVGRDFLVVRDGRGPAVVLPLAWLSVLRPQPPAVRGDAAGARPAPLDVGLTVALAGLAPERPRVALLAIGDDQPLAGELRSVGTDVVTVRLDGDQRLQAHARIALLTELVLLDR